MKSKNRLIATKGWTLQAIAALTCCISMNAHAADPLAGMSLKLDLALVNPADDCDETDDLPVAGLPGATKSAMPVTAAAPIATPAPSSLLAKEPVQIARLTPSPTERVAAAQTPAAARMTPSDASTTGSLVWDILPTDKTLNAALSRWAAQAGWQLVWELPVDYAVEARTAVPGTFEEAVGTVARSMDSAEIPMKAIFYSGNKVLRIVAKGVE